MLRSLQGMAPSAGHVSGVDSSTYNVDTVINETIRRIRDPNRGGGGTTPYATDLELLAMLRNRANAGGGVDSGGIDVDAQRELMKKYEQAIERNIAAEAAQEESRRAQRDLENEVRMKR